MKTGKLWKALILAGIVGIAGGLAGCGGEKADKEHLLLYRPMERKS